MRISFKRGAILIFVLFLCLIFFEFWPEALTPEFSQTCNQLEKVQHELHVMTYGVHRILQDMNITNFLCYGTLWGQIRISRILPWEDKTKICILNEDISAKDEVFISRIFRKQGFSITYDSTEGLYYIYKINNDGSVNNEKNVRVELPVFELDKVVNQYRRVGWKRRVLPPFCELVSLDCFPPYLIKPPLPRKVFGGKLLPVPREGIEIQKYHYRDNWWKEVTVKNC